MHKKNAIEFVTLLGFFFGFVCVNHEVFCVWCGLFLSFILFLSFFLFFFGLTLINVCTTRVDITFSSNNLLSQLRGALLKEQDVPSASVKKEERGGKKQQMRQIFGKCCHGVWISTSGALQRYLLCLAA